MSRAFPYQSPNEMKSIVCLLETNYILSEFDWENCFALAEHIWWFFYGSYNPRICKKKKHTSKWVTHQWSIEGHPVIEVCWVSRLAPLIFFHVTRFICIGLQVIDLYLGIWCEMVLILYSKWLTLLISFWSYKTGEKYLRVFNRIG